MALADTLNDIQLKTMNAVHKTILNVSRGRFGRTLGNMPVVKVTTTGRKSGSLAS